MPLYKYGCSGCGRHYVEIRSIERRDEPHYCEDCDIRTVRAMTAPELITIQGGGTRGHKKLKFASIEERLGSKYGDNP